MFHSQIPCNDPLHTYKYPRNHLRLNKPVNISLSVIQKRSTETSCWVEQNVNAYKGKCSVCGVIEQVDDCSYLWRQTSPSRMEWHRIDRAAIDWDDVYSKVTRKQARRRWSQRQCVATHMHRHNSQCSGERSYLCLREAEIHLHKNKSYFLFYSLIFKEKSF